MTITSPTVAAHAATLPPPRGGLRGALAGPRLMHHNRLVALVLLGNLVVGVVGGASGWWSRDQVALDAIASVVVVDLALAVLVRQQHVINVLFRLATAAPTSWPLAVRRVLGKVYHHGGLHVGGAIAGTAWFLVLLGSQAYVATTGLVQVPVTALWSGGLLALVLVAMIVLARPSARAARHDQFERSHRLLGWTALALVWVHVAVSSEVTWHRVVLGVVTLSIALPWLRLRRVRVDLETPSSHVAIARFDHGVTPFAGSSTALSRSPLLEWHHFANVPTPGLEGFRLTISRSGDWTGALIDDRPTHLWVKGVPCAGVGNVDALFRSVVWIATGSGIGPCLPHLLAGTTPSHLVWSTRNPRRTYGDGLVDEILAAQPHAQVWDTDELGKPDLLLLAYQAYVDFEAEAVIVISNKRTTWQVVEGLERRGIPAYGAIWDS